MAQAWQSGAMGDSLEDELVELRRRAYGPDADITTDEDAVTRLRVLEERLRARRVIDAPPDLSAADLVGALPQTPAPSAPSDAAPSDAVLSGAARSGASSESAAPDGARDDADGASAPGSPHGTAADPAPHVRRRRAWRPLVGACALTAVVVAALTVPITLWVAALPDQPYAVLHPIDAPPNTVFFSPESEAQRFEDFLGMHVSTGALDYQQGRCILVELQPDRDDEYQSSGTRGACSAPGFEAVIDVSAVDSELSATARAALGDVTAVRFAVVGDEVHVFVANAPDPGSES